MTRWTEETYKSWSDEQDPDADPPESVLQRKITAWAREHGYPCLSFRQSPRAKGFLLPGWPDVSMALPDGQMLFLELKTKKGYLRKAQKQIQKELLFLGHNYHICRTWKKFLEIVDKI